MTGSRMLRRYPRVLGFALLEVMVALLIMLLGILVITRGELQLRQALQRAAQREQVRALAQSQLERLQACAMEWHDDAEGDDCTRALAVGECSSSGSPCRLQWRVVASHRQNDAWLKTVQVSATWQTMGQSALSITQQGAMVTLPPRVQ